MNMLAIDTSTNWLTVAVGDETVCKRSFSQSIGNRHAEQLAVIVRELMTGLALETSALDAVGVVVGPGSFTGLRVGISFAQGLALPLGVRTVAINALDALSHQASGLSGQRISPLIDARKGQVYAALYNVGQGHPIPASPQVAMAPAEWLSGLPKGTLVIGNGVETYREMIRHDCRHLVMLEENIITISPPNLYKLCTVAVAAGETLDPGGLEACYIRQADAVCQKDGI